jgi:hypothetical protein
MRDFGFVFATVRPGTDIKETKRILTPSATSPQRIRVELENFSLLTNWKLIFGSVRERDVLLRVMMEKRAPAKAARIITIQSAT